MKAEFPDVLFYFVDGTVVEVGESGDVAFRRMLWNHKHQINALSFFILVAPNGRIVHASAVDCGSTHDKTAWEQSDAVQQLQKRYADPPAGMRLAIGGDKAYPNITVPRGWYKYITKSGEKHAKADEGLVLSPSIAKHRAVVERSIGKLKDYLVLHRALYLGYNVARVQKIVYILASLVNQEYFHTHKCKI